MDLYRVIGERLRQGKPTVMMTLVKVEGSAPQRPGAKMVVGREGIVAGTLGGGTFEYHMAAKAAEVMASGEAILLEYEERSDNGLACGGKYTVFAEPLTDQQRLFILGCGHVGSALARLAASCSYQVLIFDDRPCPVNITGLYTQLDDYNTPFSSHVPRREDFLVITGRTHAVDLQALRAALKEPFSFIGLLGSNKKRKKLFAVLADEGIPKTALARVHCPVGLDIGARTPAEIAVSIMAQLISYDRQGMIT